MPARILVRNPQRALVLRVDAIDAIDGDLDDAASIADAMQDISSVILVSPAVPAQELRVIEAARTAGVEHVVKVTSKASADSPIARRRGQCEIEAGLGLG